jgi:hypothetical protein
MVRYISLLLFIGFAFWSCEEEATEPEDCAGVAGGENICGCTDSTATNYDSTATYDDGSCIEFSLINEWVECKKLSGTFEYQDGTGWTVMSWDGLNATTDVNGVPSAEHVYNEYGLEMVNRDILDSSWSLYHTYIEKWKPIQIMMITYGDTSITNDDWNGLIKTRQGSNYTMTSNFNEYGKLLRQETIYDDGTTQLWEYEYLEDDRRLLTIKQDGVLTYQYTWSGNKFVRNWININGDVMTRIEGTVNEYNQVINETRYGHDGQELVVQGVYSYEYECPGFQQIYP